MINGSLHDVLLKGCKSGYVFALDANTGKLFWYFWPPNVGIYKYDQLTDIRNATQNNLPWPNFPSNSSILFHCTAGGCLEADLAYDAAANVVYIPIEYVPILAAPDASAFGFPKANDNGQTSAPAGDLNSTVYAVNVATGKILWSYLIPHQSYRGGLTVSGGVVYVSTADGIQRLLNAKTGALISAMVLGGPLRQEPSVGADTNGVMKVYVDDGAPGAIVALGLPSGAATSSTSGGATTTTATTTVTTTAPGGGAVTVTSTAPGGGTATKTVVSTVTATGAATTTGIDPTLFYGVAALAAILAIVAGAFAVRGRRRSA
jgi:outer membrane protein assembly factor BamB